jgi:nucleolar GTP-binding protein
VHVTFLNAEVLFVLQPLVVALNKVDIIRLEDIDEESRQAIEKIHESGAQVVSMSTVSEEGLMEVKSLACETLLAQRVEVKMKSKKVDSVMNRLHLASPRPRDDKDRPPFIPPGVYRRSRATSAAALGMPLEPLEDVRPQRTRKLEKDIEQELGDDYTLDLKKHYLLKNDDEKYDTITEVWEGKNIADFIDPDIMEKLQQLEREEALREAAGFYMSDNEDEDDTLQAIREKAQLIRQKKKLIVQANSEKRRVNRPILPRRVVKRLPKKAATVGTDEDSMDIVDSSVEKMEFEPSSLRSRSQLARKRKREASNRSSSRVGRDQSGLSRPEHVAKARKLEKMPWRQQTKRGLASESDRRIQSLKPKHLFSGKRKLGKTQRR